MNQSSAHNMYSIDIFCQRNISLLITLSTNYQGWTPRPAGNPPHGEGGVPRPAPHCGEGGVPRPAPPHKNDQNGREVVGQNKGPNLNFLQLRKPMMEQHYNTEQCPIQPVNRIYARES